VKTCLKSVVFSCGEPCVGADMQSLAGLKVPHTTVTSAEMAAGTESVPAHCV